MSNRKRKEAIMKIRKLLQTGLVLMMTGSALFGASTDERAALVALYASTDGGELV